jgi:fatty aldehyde-generating acyl-ACP reductase
VVPYLTGQPPWFAFLLHPRDERDLFVWRGSSIIRQYSESDEESIERMLSIPPVVFGEVRFGFDVVRGELIIVPCLPREMLRRRGQGLVARAVELAAARGAPVVGLGALTSPATRGGVTLLPTLPPGLTLTTGSALTAVMARRNVAEAAQATGAGRVAVVGCTGAVGTPATRLLAEAGYDLILLGRSVARVEQAVPELVGRATVSAHLSLVAQAGIVLVLTSDRAARLEPEMLRPGTVVIDFAQPPNIEPTRYPEFARREVVAVQGGLVRIPGYSCSWDLRMPDPRDTFACLAETYLFAREGIREHSVGPPSVELARLLDRAAERHGVRPRPLGLMRELEERCGC